MLLTKNKLNSKGFGHIGLVVLVIAVTGISGVGYSVYKHMSPSTVDTYTTLTAFVANGIPFTEKACIASQSGTAPNQIDTVTALISVNQQAGPKTEVVKSGQPVSGTGYNPLAYYSIDGIPPITADNWVTSSTSTIKFNLVPSIASASFNLGIEASLNSTEPFSGSSQTIGSLTLCNAPSKSLTTAKAKAIVPVVKTTSSGPITTTTTTVVNPVTNKTTVTTTTTNSATKKTTITTKTTATTPSISAPTISLSAAPTSLVSGNSSTLTWSTTAATSCTASGAWSGSKSLTGSVSTGSLTSTISYTLDCIGAGGNVSAHITITVSPKPLYSGKLLGMNTSLTATYNSQTTETGIFNQLGVNSERGEIDFNGTSFGSPSGDGTIANWLDTLTSAGIVPLPLMNQYVELSTLNVTGFASSLTTWCEAYCAGGSFYVNNSSANATYAPQTLEILNEPYGNWWGYPGPSNADVGAYATLLKDIRTDLNNAGLSNIGITSAASPQSFGTANWDSALLADGGFAVAQGIVVHPYGLVDLSSQTGGTSTNGWGIVYEEHDMLVNAGLSANANVYATEDGWCTNQAAEPAGYTVGADCVDNYFLTEAQKDADITTVIGQLGSVSWLKGLWYYNLYPYSISGQWNSFGLYEPGTWNGNGLYVSGAATPAWGAFQAAAQANGF